MSQQQDEEKFEDCQETISNDKDNEHQQTEINQNKEDKENNNNDKNETKEQQQEDNKQTNKDEPVISDDEENSNDENDNEEQPEVPDPQPELTENDKEEIKEKIISSRKDAGELYKNARYTEALNIYSICLKDAKRAKLIDQIVILNCNKGICFNKLKDKTKALECFSKALKYDKNYSKALANRMLLYHSKEDYIEALDDFNRLKEIDRTLWNNYSHMENELIARAEVKKKQMTDEMLGKLKDLGNSILGNFGISLDNFKMIPNGQGGYSIQYQNQK